jgi:uncharacterized protein YegP (UPF0339 family)
MSRARFEVVHTGPRKFHARFVAANGETVWSTESYRRRRTALEACWLLSEVFLEAIKANEGLLIEQVDER